MYTNYYNDDIIVEINDRIVERCNYMIYGHNKVHGHSKVNVIRMDVKFPIRYHHDGNSRLISNLTKLLKEYYTYHNIAFHYVWARHPSVCEGGP